jgi:RAB protein geranylgeranyltransferase component A
VVSGFPTLEARTCSDLNVLCAAGNLVKVLLHTKVTRYLEFKSVAGSYVFKEGAKG